MTTHWHHWQAYVGVAATVGAGCIGLTACGGTLRSTSKSTAISTSTPKAAHGSNQVRIRDVGGGFHGDLQARPAVRVHEPEVSRASPHVRTRMVVRAGSVSP
jgi:hypothetical protein